MLVEDFGQNSTIVEVQCHDFDGDGTDEIFVAVVGDRMLVGHSHPCICSYKIIVRERHILLCLGRRWLDKVQNGR